MKRLFLSAGFCSLVLLGACGPCGGLNVDPQSAGCSSGQNNVMAVSNADLGTLYYSKIHWDTSGTGDLHFDLTVTAQQTIQVSNIVVNGTTKSGFIFRPTDNQTLFARVVEVFKNMNTNWPSSGPGTSGSLTSIGFSLPDGRTRYLSNISVDTDFDKIYDFVIKQI